MLWSHLSRNSLTSSAYIHCGGATLLNHVCTAICAICSAELLYDSCYLSEGLKEKDLDRFLNRSRLKTLVIHSTTAFWYLLFLSFVSSLCHERWPLEMDSASRISAVWRIYEGGCSEDGSFPPDQHHQASFSHQARISFVMLFSLSCRAY